MSSEAPFPNPLGSLKRVRVGSQNGPKIAAVRSAIAAYAPAAEVCGAEVASGVPDQPVGFEEIVRGARNRAEAAHGGGDCDLAVGLEDGLVALPAGAATVWALTAFDDAVSSSESIVYAGNTIGGPLDQGLALNGSLEKLSGTASAGRLKEIMVS